MGKVKISQINDIELSELIFGGEELGIVFTCSSKTYETMKKKHDIDIKLLGIVSNEKEYIMMEKKFKIRDGIISINTHTLQIYD